jgi:hypothetical protein
MVLLFVLLLLLRHLLSWDEIGRTAAIVSGQLRSGIMTWRHPLIRQNQAALMFGPNDPTTPVETIIQWLFEIIISQGGGLDVFYYVQAHPDHNNSEWDGNPATFAPTVGDTRVCEPFLNHNLFNNTGNRFFCLVEPELQLLNSMTNANPAWETYGYGEMIFAREQLLQQLYGTYRANMAAKQFSVATGVVYRYKLRVRPDVALTRPFVSYDKLKFNATEAGGCRTIIIPNKAIMTNGAEDSFNVGYADDMDHLLDRYVDFTTYPYPDASIRQWNAEQYLVGLMKVRYNLCLQWLADIWMVPLRSNSKFHGYTPTGQRWEPTKIYNQWQELT